MGNLVLAGASSGSTTITPTDAVTATVTLPSTGGTLQTSGSGFTTNGVAYASSTSALATGSALTFNGTNLGIGTTSPSYLLEAKSSTAAIGITGTGTTANNLVVGNTNASNAFYFAQDNSTGNNFNTGVAYGPVIWTNASSQTFVTNSGSYVMKYSSGNLGIGQTSPSYRLDVVNATGAGATTSIRLNNPGTAVGDGAQILFTSGSSTTGGCAIAGYGTALNAAAMRFFSGGNTEAMRLDENQHLLIGNTTPVTAINYYKAYIQGGTAANSNSTALPDQKCGLYLYNNEGGATNNEGSNNALVIAVNQGGSVTPANMIVGYAAYPTGTRTFQVNISGSVYNYLGVYGTLSDQKVKQDIVDASSQWQDIKNVKVRKYRLKSEVERNENAPSFIGVVAQELEQTSPNLVDSPEGCETDENVFKTVKTSVLQMKALKALQEAMERIETLETKVTELLAK